MEDPNTNENPTKKLDNDDEGNNDFSLKSDFVLQNGGFEKTVSDIELITVKAVTYTSLKDLLPLPSSPSAAAVTSPSSGHNSSWHEIPIKNPLVKQAALAYLQPMSSPQPDTGDRGLCRRLRDGCWQCECFSWINDVVVMGLREVFCWTEVDDEEDDEKVD